MSGDRMRSQVSSSVSAYSGLPKAMSTAEKCQKGLPTITINHPNIPTKYILTTTAEREGSQGDRKLSWPELQWMGCRKAKLLALVAMTAVPSVATGALPPSRVLMKRALGIAEGRP